jgi:hypothetical protein
VATGAEKPTAGEAKASCQEPPYSAKIDLAYKGITVIGDRAANLGKFSLS